jgi:transcriptional regulator with XRE-family HTH domain
MIDTFSEALGRALRQARAQAGLTLRQVAARTGGRFKASALGGYERGERDISVRRFCELLSAYGVPAPEVLKDALTRLPSEHELTLRVEDLEISTAGEPVGTVVLPEEEPTLTRRDN